jgi:hypothetical protein
MSDFWLQRKRSFIDGLHLEMKMLLLANLTPDEIMSMIPARPPTLYQLLQEIPKIETGKILDKIEDVL